jgi:hypothetical protein
MGSSCELLSCVDVPSASLHSCKVSSRTKRGISTRGTPALATWASKKALCGAGGARTLPCEHSVCVGVPQCMPPCYSLHRQLSHSSFTLCTPPQQRQRVRRAATHIRRRWCIRDAETYPRCVRWLAGTRWISRQSDRAVREGKQLPAMVLMRGRGRRCMWSVDTASGLSARVLAKTVQEMGWPGRREGWCLGCG